MLFSAIALSAAEYCEELITSTNGKHTANITCSSLGNNQYQFIFESIDAFTGYNAAGSNFYMEVNGVGGTQVSKNLTQDGNKLSYTFESNVVPNIYVGDFYVNYADGEAQFNIPTDEDFSVVCAPAAEDTELPVMKSATFVSASDKSVVIAVEATDNVKVASYLVKNGDVELGSYTAVNNNITVNGLEPGTTYQLTVYAKDASDNISAQGITVEVTTTSIPMSPFCDTEIGHEGNVNADPNSFILLSVGSDGAGHTIVTIRQDAAKNTSMFDYINIVGIKEIGSDIATGGSDAMAILFNTPTPNAEGNITFMIQWSIINWGGRWQYNVTLPAEAICANVDPYPSEPYLYCSYTDNNLKSGNANVALTWATDASGNVVIDIEDGEGASNSAFRNGGFELGGGLSFADSWKVYSGTNHQTVEDATVYFNEVGTLSNNDKRYTLTKKAEAVLPSNAVIVWQGHAFSWKNDQAGGAYYIGKTFAYSYGESCPSLETPTNVAVSEEGIITFTGSALAETYTASVYLGGILKYRQDVTNGGTLDFTPYVSGTYQVTVTASATGYPTTAPSEPFDWQRTVVPASPTNSAYCEQEMSNGNTLAKFTWETDDNGNIIITIAEALGGESSASVFRDNAFNINNLRVGTHSTGSDYFTSSWVGSVQTLALKDPNVKPGIGEPITYNGIVEYITSENQNAYPTLQFNDYLYGAKCEGQKRVTASVNDAAMGTAKVNGQDEVYVEPDTEVTFTATPNDGYVFVNWTKGDEVVSTSATYTTTIISALSLVANFDYIRTIYCQQEVLTNAGRKVYLTVGQAATAGKYQIKIEGTSSLTITAINNANTAMNNIKFTGTDADGNPINYDGNDVPLTNTNGGWTYSNEGYGVITSAEIEPSTGKTWKDMWMWRPDLYFKTSLSNEEQINAVLVLQNHFDWSNTCEADTEKPVLGSAQLISTTHNAVIIQVAATDNKEIAAYHIVDAANAIDKNIAATDGTITIAGLKHSTTYQFTITAIDKSANESANSATITATTNQISYCDLLTGNGGDENYADINGRCLLTISKLTGNNLRVTVEKTAESANLDFLYVVAGGATPYPATVGENGKTEGGEQSLSVDLNYATLTFPIAIEVKWSTVGVPGEYLVNCTDILEAYLCQDLADKTAPVMGSATLANVSHNSAIINVEATDNEKVAKYRVVYGTSTIEVEPINNQIVVNGLQESTAYIFTIYAIDAAGNVSVNSVQVAATTAAYVAAPSSLPTAPTWPANQVQAAYSDTYNANCNFGEWGSATQYTPDTYGKKFVTTELGYFGLIDLALNCSKMEALHLDVWSAESFTLRVVPIHGGAEVGVTKTIMGGQWNAIDIALSEFVGVENWSNVYQIKIDNAPNQTFWLNNIYFYTTQVSSDVTPPANLKATAIPSFTTAVIECSATDESGSVNFKVMYGTEQKAVGSADSGATARLNITNLQAGSKFTMTVIATDVYGNEAAEPVNVTFTTLTYPAPAPTPIWKAENVFSIYSNAYNTTVTRAFGWGWGPTTVEIEETLVQGDQALLYTTSNFAGWELNGNTSIGDLREYPYLHMDIYVENAGSIQFTPIWGAEALKTYTLKAGWNSIDIDLTAEFAGINLANIYQLKWAAMPATCFIDNVYFYRVVIDEDVDLTQLNNGMAYDVTLKRNFAMGDDGWNTISLPFALNAQQIEDIFGDDTKVTKLTSSNLISSTEIDLQFVEVTAMEAATPYLIHPTNNVDAGALVEDVVINVTPNIIEAGITQMIPVLKTENFTGKDNAFFLGPDDNLYNQSADGKIKALRAYFKFSTLTPAQLNNLRARVVFNENTETGVDNLITDEAPTKMIQNGQLIIIRNGIKYNVQGQKL